MAGCHTKPTSCTVAKVVAPTLANVPAADPLWLSMDNIDPSLVQCRNVKSPKPNLSIEATLSLSKPGADGGTVKGSLIPEVGFASAAVAQKVEAKVVGGYRCAEGTCTVDARATKAGKVIASMKGSLKSLDPRCGEYEEVLFVFTTSRGRSEKAASTTRRSKVPSSFTVFAPPPCLLRRARPDAACTCRW